MSASLNDEKQKSIFRLPGGSPESTIFNNVAAHLDENIALLTVACQRAPDKQDIVYEATQEVSRTNRDPHLLFNQVRLRLGFVPEATVVGAFLAIWMSQNPKVVDQIVERIREALGKKDASIVAR